MMEVFVKTNFVKGLMLPKEFLQIKKIPTQKKNKSTQHVNIGCSRGFSCIQQGRSVHPDL